MKKVKHFILGILSGLMGTITFLVMDILSTSVLNKFCNYTDFLMNLSTNSLIGGIVITLITIFIIGVLSNIYYNIFVNV